ncbi:peptide chain release factor N(5)-glutamine methyltransferase [Hymenobacter sp. BT770]|uniref:peptide chain release factor N(5)-glutamine methyltransferase n=1 Tax=Hymenobacter sp. BT770 TaxID=2886942 RepID=UPI001D116030|nr:peptide chain release factor N(5)-glutamine methyltransferase [Hymenobacter sp. BT770]MCC3153715.1 peptide chain release factor N(5)-glutamine methyltransferase [Hymenobacter sp. BT770]MDO3413678.1 peptide chain release factor N(5)-glutamine methyltransferase [Hymenobacter sp. BT770]
MTVREFTTALATALQPTYPEREAQAIATLVVEYLLDMDSLQRMMDAQETVPPEALAALPALQERLLAHEPVQYVLGQAFFGEMTLEVTPATLIPRPETEELVRVIAQEQQGRTGLHVLDVGTGSGCLAIALADALPQADVLAVDISEAALDVARRNAARYAPTVVFQHVDILQGLPAAVAPGTLDVLVSNPPYVRESERLLMRENVLAWEPATALFVPDDDPLLFYRRLRDVGHDLLRPGGGLYLEINEALGSDTAALLIKHGYEDVRVLTDMFGKARIVRGTRA